MMRTQTGVRGMTILCSGINSSRNLYDAVVVQPLEERYA